MDGMPWLKPLYDLWHSDIHSASSVELQRGRAALATFSAACAALQDRFPIAPTAADVLAALYPG